MEVVTADLHSMARAVERQAGGFAAMSAYSTIQCGNTDGFEDLMAPLAGPVTALAGVSSDLMGACHRGLLDTADTLRAAAAGYDDADLSNAESIVNSTFPDAPYSIPDIPIGYGDFNNRVDGTLAAPDAAAAEADATAAYTEIKGLLGTVEDAFQLVTGWSLVDWVVGPIAGDYWCLKVVSEAYKNLGTHAFGLAANLRSASFALSGSWNDGAASAAFDYHAFRWNMGVGGVGDIAMVVSKNYNEAYEFCKDAIKKIFGKVSKLVEKLVLRLVPVVGWVNAIIEEVGSWTRGDSAIKQLIDEVINDVAEIHQTVTEMNGKAEELKTKMAEWQGFFDLTSDALDDPVGTAREILDKEYAKAIQFETEIDNWPNEIGAARLGLLPIGSVSIGKSPGSPARVPVAA